MSIGCSEYQFVVLLHIPKHLLFVYVYFDRERQRSFILSEVSLAFTQFIYFSVAKRGFEKKESRKLSKKQGQLCNTLYLCLTYKFRRWR